jgi:hypothetical protein
MHCLQNLLTRAPTLFLEHQHVQPTECYTGNSITIIERKHPIPEAMEAALSRQR